jgi:hypothetical protein
MPKPKPNTAEKTTALLLEAGIRQHDWDMWFSCPDDELEECLFYECARRGNMWPRVMKVLAEYDHPANFTVWFDSWARLFELILAFPEFPRLAWMDIDQKKRKHRLENLARRCPQRLPVEIMGAHAIDIIRADEDEFDGPNWPNGTEILTRYRKKSRYLGEVLETLYVDWQYPDNAIVVAFKNWIKEHRPQTHPLRTKSGRPNTGQEYLRRALRYIGLFTLSPKLNTRIPPQLTRPKLIEYANSITPKSSQLLCKEAKQMREDESKAQQFLQVVEADILTFRHKRLNRPSLEGCPPEFLYSLLNRERFRRTRDSTVMLIITEEGKKPVFV